MSALAMYLYEQGHTVYGSDKVSSDATLTLEKAGIKVFYGHSKDNLKDADYFVYTSAVSDNNPELNEARLKNIPIVKRSELLSEILFLYKKSVAISGSHGKTTATAMLTHVLQAGGLFPTAFIGGNDKNYGNFKSGKKDIVITEACEYKKNFLDLKPDITVILNVDNDHLESYKDFNEEVKSFSLFAKNSVCVINADDKNFSLICPENYITYAIKNTAKYCAKNIREESGKISFTVYYCNKKLGRLTVFCEGKHNVYNALAVIAVARFLGVKFCDIQKGFYNFCGVERRNEYLGKIEKINCYSDYAHHPTEINAFLKSQINLEKTLVVFQPHTYTRTENLMGEFIKSLSKCKNLIVYKTFPAREKYKKSGSAYTLYKNLLKNNVHVYYEKTFKGIENRLKDIPDIEKIVFIGAGDLYFYAKKRAKKTIKPKM